MICFFYFFTLNKTKGKTMFRSAHKFCNITHQQSAFLKLKWYF
jgi:hypothetical protein